MADKYLKVFDKMRLVEIAKFERELSPIELVAGIELLDQLVESIAADDPFRANPDIFAK